MSLAIVHSAIPASLNVALMIGLLIIACILLRIWSGRSGWSGRHHLAVAGGLLITYTWYGFIQVPSVGNTCVLIDTAGNIIFASGAVLILVIAWKRTQTGKALQT